MKKLKLSKDKWASLSLSSSTLSPSLTSLPSLSSHSDLRRPFSRQVADPPLVSGRFSDLAAAVTGDSISFVPDPDPPLVSGRFVLLPPSLEIRSPSRRIPIRPCSPGGSPISQSHGRSRRRSVLLRARSRSTLAPDPDLLLAPSLQRRHHLRRGQRLLRSPRDLPIALA
ncbi:hypothetical protein TIFTF001_004880 [Ficus carica]|uniref:Uncharacterized protein n=1 Tax=Ficus carica TaxID=3494 RepID=A0AA87ZEG5_FICCA|nr:hypothetical protein TIFTF001_004880 [Ficus carica]